MKLSPSRRDVLRSGFTALCPGTAHAFLFSSEGEPFFEGTGKPIIDLDASAGDLRRPARASNSSKGGHELTFKMQCTNTGERLMMRFTKQDGLLAAERPFDLNHFLRDWRENQIRPIDPKIISGLATVVSLARQQGWNGEVQITSGYRTRKTNELLRSRGAGAARNSLHIKAMAIDFALPGVSPAELGALARETLPGGVGTYAGFVHIDSGPERSWTG